jgi:hypothetical protein
MDRLTTWWWLEVAVVAMLAPVVVANILLAAAVEPEGFAPTAPAELLSWLVLTA